MNQLDDKDITIIIVDDDLDVRDNISDLLSTEFSSVCTFESPVGALELLKESTRYVVLTDLRMPEHDGLVFAENIQEICRELPVILMTGYGEVSVAVKAMKQGVYDFIEKPFDADILVKTLKRAVEKRCLDLSLQITQKELAFQKGIDQQIVGHCPAMKQLKRQILRLAQMDVPVLIQGETGSGKELVARSLHEYSPRCDEPFVAINCAAIPDQIAESELFGHVRGAFTDAHADRKGKFEHADGGTIFLDEVESLSLPLQAKLLRALSDQRITPLGSNKEISFNCRVISATKEELRGNENFRQDLFFRLQVAILNIPPLKQRNEDIVSLFEFFASQQCEHFGVDFKSASDVTRSTLLGYSWPGNVRELINVATRYAIDMCEDLSSIDTTQPNVQLSDDMSLKEQIQSFEEKLLRAKLDQFKGKVSLVLDDLKLERRTFNQKLNRYSISVADYRDN